MPSAFQPLPWQLPAWQTPGFRTDPRFTVAQSAPPPTATECGPPTDPLADAFARGIAEGAEQAGAECEAALLRSEARCAELLGALEGVVAAETEALAERLRETVLVLCDTIIVPAALHPDGLARRCAAAAAMLVRAQDDRAVYLHPDDAARVAPLLAPGLAVRTDPSLERGALRMETPDGGVEDGPAQWRRALREMVAQC